MAHMLFWLLSAYLKTPGISLTTLWSQIQDNIMNELGVEPARSNQRGPTVAYKLWHLGQISGSESE